MRVLRWSMLVVVAGALVLSGCIGSGPNREGFLRVAIEANPTNLDPRIAGDVGSSRVNTLVYSGLLSYTDTLDLQPDLAAAMPTISEDGMTVTFPLRRDVTFHHGKPFSAEDVVHTFQSILGGKLETRKRSAYADIAEVTAVDAFTVRFRLHRPLASFLEGMTLGIVPKPRENESLRLRDQPVGTGPYRFESWNQDSEVVLLRNDDYFGEIAQNPGIIYTIVPDTTIRLLALEMDVVDLVVNNIPPERFLELCQEEHLQCITEQGINYKYMGFNVRDPIVGNAKVRRAMAHALNRDEIIEFLLGGFADPAITVFPEQHWAYNPALTPIAYDPDEARRLLDEAGFPDPDGDGPEARLEVTFKTSTNPQANRVAVVMQQQLADVGITMHIQSFEWATFYEDVQNGNFQMFSLKWVGINEPDFFYNIFHSQSVPPNGLNRGHYKNAELDRLVEAARVEGDRQRRAELYHQVQDIVARDLPYVSLWFDKNRALMHNRVTGFTLLPNAGFQVLSRVRVE